MTTLIPKYDQGSTNAVNRPINVKLAEIFSVKDFGAVGDGTTDDTTAIQNAISAAQSLTMSGNSGIYGNGSFYVGTSPTVFFPTGVYKVSSALTADTTENINYMQFFGENAIIVPTVNTFNVFGGIGYDVNFEGLIFRGGQCAISIKTNNIDSDKIAITNCEFHVQTVASVQTDNNSQSTILSFYNCKFMQTDSTITQGYSLYLLSSDYTVINNCWFSSYTPCPIYNGGGMFLNDSIGVPGGTLTHWIENHGDINVNLFRFGGENGGRTFINNYNSIGIYPNGPSTVKIINCPWSEAQSPYYVVAFYAFPNVLELSGLDGFVGGTAGLYFDSSLSYSDFATFQQYGIVKIDNNYYQNGLVQFPVNNSTNGKLGEKVINSMLARDGYFLPEYVNRFYPSFLMGSGGISSGAWTVTNSNAAISYGTSNYSVPQITVTANVAGQGASAAISASNYLTYANLGYGEVYTFLVCVDVVPASPIGGVVLMSINIGSSTKTVSLGRGSYVIGVPFTYLNGTGGASSTYDTCYIGVAMTTYGDFVNIYRNTLIYGLAQYAQQTLEVQASGVPGAITSGTFNNVGYYPGDIGYVFAPTSGNPPGYVCVSTNTFKAMANLA